MVALPTTLRDVSYLSEIIPCSMLTDNDDYIRVYYGEAVVCFATLLPILEDVMESATF